MKSLNCYHCGDVCETASFIFDEKNFCCNGCKTVYEIFSSNNLKYYYELQSGAGSTPSTPSQSYDFLDNQEILSKLLIFNEGNHQIVELKIPNVHCSSCIWILENLGQLHSAITKSEVNFPKKKVRISYRKTDFSLKNLVELLAKIGYEPNLRLEDYDHKQEQKNRSLIYQLGIAGFAFGNVMFLSFPEYFEIQEFWLDQYKVTFRWLMFAFSLPVMFYAARDYFVSAYKGLRIKLLTIDVPIALGIFTLFIRSTVDIVFDLGSGFFDSLTGLVFFLLLGRYFQQQTYNFLSFERDYKSYFPMAVTKILSDGSEESIAVYRIQKGDRLWIRNMELIPVDGLLLEGRAQLDYSFVTGESDAVMKEKGELLFAGGKQMGAAFEMKALKSVSQSYLTQLWSNVAFSKNKISEFQTLTDSISKRFTVIVLSIAVVASIFWMWYDPSKVLNVFTAVLIIACPCAIALAAPFTLGNMLRIFGQHKFYIKDTNTIERMAQINAAIFDKTGTLTSTHNNTICYEGIPLTSDETAILKQTLRASNHPLSHQLYRILKSNNILTLDEFYEEIGYGIEGKWEAHSIKVGSANYIGKAVNNSFKDTSVHICADSEYKGCFVFKNEYRKGVSQVFKKLSDVVTLTVLSGDNNGEQITLEKLLPKETKLHFNQKPEQKLNFIKTLQDKGEKVVMIGDGLNDAGALAQSDVGIVISENINVFSPACDGILDADQFLRIPDYFQMAKQAMQIIKWSFLVSLCYNLIGLYFAITGQLAPVIAAVLMPISSITIVVFTTIATTILGKKLKRKT